VSDAAADLSWIEVLPPAQLRSVMIGLLACGAAGIPAAPMSHASPNSAELRVLTYNVHWTEQTDAATGVWTTELNARAIARDVRGSGAEVVALEEVQTYRVGSRLVSQAAMLARLLGWTAQGIRRHVYFRAGSPGAVWCRRKGRPARRLINGRFGVCLEHGKALISRRPLLRRRFIHRFPPSRRAETAAYTDRPGRNALRASIMFGGRRIWLAAVHLSRREPAAACQLRDLLPQLITARPIVVLGDFNLEPHTEVPNPPCAGVPRRPLDQLRRVGLRRGAPGGATWPAYDPRERIDHIFAGAPLKIRAARPLDNCGAARCSSDHRPFLAVLRVPR
jgi:endonuclease/exonuclease/phosphatase family metal-dependent hydrolase